jgi:hypothetical protein
MARIGFADCKLQRQTFMEPELRRSQGIILPDCGKPIEGFPQTLIAQTAIFECEPLHILEFNACGIVGLMSVNGMASPLVGPFARETMINENVFILATKKLFEWSKTQNCRFYAIVHDATGPSKARYKHLQEMVQGNFYPFYPSPQRRGAFVLRCGAAQGWH